MGQAQVDVDPVAGAAALPHQGRDSTGLTAQTDAYLCDVGDTPTGLLVPANGTLAFGNAAQLDRFPLPAIKAKDAVRLADRYPTLQVVQGTACLAAGLDVCPVQRGSEGGVLLGGEQPRRYC